MDKFILYCLRFALSLLRQAAGPLYILPITNYTYSFMKFVISSSALSAHMQTIGRVIVQKNNLPILDCFLFSLEGKTLTLTASDNDTTLITKIELVENECDFRFAVNAKTLQDAIKEIPDQPLEFYVNQETYEITVEYQNGQYRFMGQCADEYPTAIHENEEGTSLVLESPKLLSALTRALISAGMDQLRPVMNSVYFDIRDGSLSVVASDGCKLSLTNIKSAQSSRDGGFIFPQKPATLLRTILAKENEEMATINFNKLSCDVHVGHYTLLCRLVEGNYPPYRSVIPQDNPHHITVNRAALISATRRVKVFATSNYLLRLHIEDNHLTISTQDVDFSMSAQENLLCEYYGNPMTIGFKGDFFLDLLNNIEGEEIIIKLADPSRAGILVPAMQKEGEEMLMLLMPLMVNE